ncbi:MAG: hypothetical protein Q8L23_13470 [Caulobacter sp.]|nr:hypothetical protein [Caulobacter sp.]
MSDTAAFRIARADAPPAFGFATLFAGADGLARAVAVVFGGGFVLGMAIVLVAAAG